MIGEYTPIDFSKVSSVKLVDYNDKDYIEWQKQIYGGKTNSQLRREKERQQYPEEFEKLKQLWENRTCVICKKLYKEHFCYGNCSYGNSPSYIKHSENHNADNCDFFKIDADKCKKFLPHLQIHPMNINYYLYDLGLIEKPKNPMQEAKKKELLFLDDIGGLIERLNNIIKIHLKNGKITFKIMDCFFRQNNKHGIIEYKNYQIYSYENKEFKQQLIDYFELIKLALTISDIYLFLVFKAIEKDNTIEFMCLPNIVYNFSESVMVNILTDSKEKQFFEKHNMQTGLSAWM